MREQRCYPDCVDNCVCDRYPEPGRCGNKFEVEQEVFSCTNKTGHKGSCGYIELLIPQTQLSPERP